jgi:hypothetical protein
MRMPLVGIVDPSHKEMARDTSGRLPAWLPLDEALASARDEKWAPWTPEILRAMFEGYQERGDLISTSSLVSHCPRAEIIKRRMDYTSDLEDLYVPFRGTMIHQVLEGYAGDDTIAEHRFFTELDGIEISCSPDTLTRTTLSDYKVTETPPRYNYPYANHTEQVQINAYIVRHATAFQKPGGEYDEVNWQDLPFDPRENPVEKVQLIYMAPKFVKTLVVERTETIVRELKAGAKLVKGKVPDVWSDEKVENLIGPRLVLFREALQQFPQWPLGAEEEWGGEKGWACPGYPLCRLPNCLAKRYPERLTW